jgi:putative hydrolase of the HAD superfamily
MRRPARRCSTLLIDWGGVLTTSVQEAFDAFALQEGLGPGAVTQALRGQPDAPQPLFELECGRLSTMRFELWMCATLGLGPQ